jgi:integrase
MRVRKRVAQTTQNPKILKITFVSFRHWGATNVYSYTKNILLVQKLLGHKKIQNTMKYTQLIQFKDDEYDVATATTVEEAKDNLKVGFEYVAEKNGIMLFKRPKRYSTYSQKY